MELQPGDRVDRYVLVEPLGEGGQGSVWKAEDPLHPGAARAVKVVPLSAVGATEAERVRREARALARLEHASLVPCHALFEDLKLGVLGMALDFVDGVSLGVAADDARMTDRHRTAALRHVAHALAYVHEAGLVHRDLKLDNVLVTRAFWESPLEPGNVKLVDFGIAHLGKGLEQAVKGGPLTAIDTIVGTIAYIAPELLDPSHFGGRGPSPAADVFAFGVLGWKLLVGGHPTGLPQGAGVVDYGAAYRRAAESGSKWPPGAPSGAWGDLLRDALALRPEARVTDGAELARRAEQAGDFATVIRSGASPESVSSAGPTSVASPAAMLVKTEQLGPAAARGDDPTLRASIAQAPERTRASHVAGVVPPEKPRPAGPGATIAVVMVGALAFAVTWKLSHPPPESPPLAAVVPSAPPSMTAPPLAPPSAPSAVGSAETAAAPLDAQADAATANLPGACSAVCDCCPSGNDCGGPCDDAIGADPAHLRLGSVAPASDSLELCVRSRAYNRPPTCTPSTAALDGGVPEPYLLVEKLDLSKGVEVTLRDRERDAGSVTIVLPSKLTRLAFCKGIDLELADAGRSERVRLYLDPAGPAPARRCPAAPANGL